MPKKTRSTSSLDGIAGGHKMLLRNKRKLEITYHPPTSAQTNKKPKPQLTLTPCTPFPFISCGYEATDVLPLIWECHNIILGRVRG